MRTQRFGELNARITGGTDGLGGGDGPVVVLLHGFGAPGHDLVGLGPALPAPEGTRFVFPEAPLELPMMGEARAWWLIDMERMQRALMTGQLRDLTQDVPEGLAEANTKVMGLLDAVQSDLDVTGDKLVLGGFSQGAMLSLDVALRSSRPLAGLIVMSGTLLAQPEWVPLMDQRKGLPVVQTHGAYDPILPFSIAEQLRDHLVAAGLDVQWLPFGGQHEIPRPALAAVGEMLAKTIA